MVAHAASERPPWPKAAAEAEVAEVAVRIKAKAKARAEKAERVAQREERKRIKLRSALVAFADLLFAVLRTDSGLRSAKKRDQELKRAAEHVGSFAAADVGRCM